MRKELSATRVNPESWYVGGHLFQQGNVESWIYQHGNVTWVMLDLRFSECSFTAVVLVKLNSEEIRQRQNKM